jgi:hypothetical protein
LRDKLRRRWRLHKRFEYDPELLEAESLLVSGVTTIACRLPWMKSPEFREPGRTKVDRAREYLQAYCTEFPAAGGAYAASLPFASSN